MKKYVKPMVLANEELAEGVYADSGAVDECYKYSGYTGSDYSAGGYYEYNIQFVHSNESHRNCTHKFTITFSSQPGAVSNLTSCSDAVISGNTITVTWNQTGANPGENPTVGMKIKWVGEVKGVPTGGYGWQE